MRHMRHERALRRDRLQVSLDFRGVKELIIELYEGAITLYWYTGSVCLVSCEVDH